MKKLDGLSLDLEKQNIDKLKELFPIAVEEGKINFDLLRAMLGDEVDDSKEKYQFTWKGKTKSIKLAQTPSVATLRPCKDKSKDWDSTDNLYIEGDNLEVLKQLQKTYYGKVKMIYIDPPYNTGEDFIYNDSFSDSLKNYRELTSQTSSSNPESSGRFHTAWLNLMYPRLILAKNLLKDDGVIFVSIDDHEEVNCKKILDGVFGENNFIANIVRNTNSSKNQSLFVSVSHEYCFVYAKNIEYLKQVTQDNKWSVDKNNINEYVKRVNNLINEGLSKEEITKQLKILTKYPRFIDFTNYWYFDERGLYRKGDLGGVKNGNMNPLYNPLTKRNDPVPPGGYRYSDEKLQELVNQNRIHFHTDGSLPTIKRYLSENSKQRPKSIMSDDQRPDYSWLKKENLPFDNPKQLAFIKRIISIFDKDSLIMDFFAGSSTTAHAIMQLNAEDGGKRNFIMIQLPEMYDKTKEAYKAGYKNICEIGEERIRLAGEQIKHQWQEEHPGEEFNTDIGFKVFELDSTNIIPWDDTVQYNESNLFELSEVFKKDRTKEDILYEIMLKYGIFDKKVEQIDVNGKTMFRIGKRYMVVCLEDDVNSEDVKAIGELGPRVVVFKEDGFINDNAKINATYNLEKYGVEDIKCI